jgi:hypothetical protein
MAAAKKPKEGSKREERTESKSERSREPKSENKTGKMKKKC